MSMIKIITLVLVCIASPATAASNPLEKQILKLNPQADRDGDGKLSKAEETALHRMILKRFPQADADGDGLLSTKEQQILLRRAANRAKQKGKRTAAKGETKDRKPPTHANVKYGEHERNVFDIWLADSVKPTPLAIYIHGGGFTSGSKEKLKPNELDQLLKAGISVAAINYRYMTPTTPLPTPHHDARRALQLMRSKAKEWNIDKDRVAAFGGSAGAQICMWLAFSDDMADPDSKDPVERESTRLTCVATSGGQTSNGTEFWREIIGPLLGGKQIESLSRPFGGETDPEKAHIAKWGAKTLEEANETAKSCSAISIISPDDPPIFMSYGMPPTAKLPTDPKRVRGWLIHHVNLGIALKERADELNVENHLKYPGAKTAYESQIAFFKDKLLGK